MRFRTMATLLTMLLLGGATLTTATAQTPAASPVASGSFEMRSLDVEGRGFSISPDGQWLAGVGPDQTPCFWDLETLTPRCAAEELPILQHPSFPSMAWAPDNSAVAFSLDAPRMAYDSDIYLFERESGALTNLTDDGYEGSVFHAPDGMLIDMVPSWSPDSRQIVFSRSMLEDATSSTTVVRIDRSGGDPVEITRPDIEEPMVIWTPMHWLPDDTIVFSVVASQIDEPVNGVWRVGVDGANPEKLMPGDGGADIPAVMVADVSPATGTMSVYSPLLLAQYATTWERPIFWISNLADGVAAPLPLYDVNQGVALDPTATDPASRRETGIAFPAAPAALSPDGASALIVYRELDGPVSLAMLDLATGEITLLSTLPDGTPVHPVAPQWADDGTVLLLTGDGPMVLALSPEG